MVRFFSESIYPEFERVVAIALSIGVIGVIIISGGHLAVSLFETAMGGFVEFDYAAFQRIFEQILTILIALEFNHSLMQVVAGAHGFIQVRTVVLIGILAVVRKFIVLDIETTSGLFLLGLAMSILALGTVYALMIYVERSGGDLKESAPGAQNLTPEA